MFGPWTRTLVAVAALMLAPLGMSACAKDKSQQTTDTVEAPEQPAAGAQGTPLDSVMPYYDIIRSALARDDAAAAAQGAAKLRDAATNARDSAPEAMNTHLDAMARHAETMAAMKPEEIAKMRTTFGEISRPMVTMMQATPEMAANYHMFECSMADGFTYWVQKDPKISNPYMGTSMPECGAKVDMTHGKGGN